MQIFFSNLSNNSNKQFLKTKQKKKTFKKYCSDNKSIAVFTKTSITITISHDSEY